MMWWRATGVWLPWRGEDAVPARCCCLAGHEDSRCWCCVYIDVCHCTWLFVFVGFQMWFYHIDSLVLSTCIKIILPPQHLSHPMLRILHATRLGFIFKSWRIVLVLFCNGEPLEVCKQGDNITQCLVLKDYLGTWRFSFMAECLPGTSEAPGCIPRITKKMERLFGMLWVMDYGKEGVKHRVVRLLTIRDITRDWSPVPPGVKAPLSDTLYHTLMYYTVKLNFILNTFIFLLG